MSPSRGSLFSVIASEVSSCSLCPRLVSWRGQVASEKKAAHRDEIYWGRPVPGFGDPRATVLIVGLAPAAHGGNRTGRVFTGDRSGDWLFRALHRAGFANRPESIARDDGLELRGAYVTAAVKCAPPGNKPTPVERDTCLPFLRREMVGLTDVRVVVALGGFAYQVVARELEVRPAPRFGHLVEVIAPSGVTILCSFHPSQQNTFTGRLTERDFDAVFTRARDLVTLH